MTDRSRFKQITGPRMIPASTYQRLQDIVFDDCRVVCSILIMDNNKLSIRTRDYAEYTFAKLALKRHVEMEIEFGGELKQLTSRAKV